MKNLFLYQRNLHEKIGDGDNQSVLIPFTVFLEMKKKVAYYLAIWGSYVSVIFISCFLIHNELHDNQYRKFLS